MKREHFEGTYFKAVAKDGFSFAIIQSRSSISGDGLQVILGEGSFDVLHPDSFQREGDLLRMDIAEKGLSMHGTLEIRDKHPLSHHAMGPFFLFSMECCHSVESMYHELWGTLSINGVVHEFSPGYGYIEGDSGKSFPNEYFWFNASGENYGVMIAYATIPFGPFRFKGLLGFLVADGKQHSFCTYSGAKVVSFSATHITIKKGRYQLSASWDPFVGHSLKAPVAGKMKRVIQEALRVEGHVELRKDGVLLWNVTDPFSSVEWMAGNELQNKKK
ncbi:MAG: hypothetical protein SPG64_05540 [Candidatus Enteromonas sp.]|nr:hypothetical protein [Candidatus Enteromonas sp.]